MYQFQILAILYLSISFISSFDNTKDSSLHKEPKFHQQNQYTVKIFVQGVKNIIPRLPVDQVLQQRQTLLYIK